MIVVIGGIAFNREDDGFRRGEACDIVHMSVRVVPHTPFTQPDGLGAAQPLGERTFVVQSPEPGIAHLNIREQPFLGDEDAPATVHFDAAAFQNQRTVSICALCTGDRQRRVFGDVFRHTRVVQVVVVLSPRVEAPLHQLHRTVGAVHAGRTGVAHPDAIGARDMQAHVVEVHGVRGEHLARLLAPVRIVAQYVDAFVPRECADDFRIDPGNWRELAGPVWFVHRPRQPCGRMALPLRRHTACRRSQGRHIRQTTGVRRHRATAA